MGLQEVAAGCEHFHTVFISQRNKQRRFIRNDQICRLILFFFLVLLLIFSLAFVISSKTQ